MRRYARDESTADRVTSVRQAAAVCNVTPPVVRRWLSLGLITEPPWTMQQLHQVRDETDPQGLRRGPQVTHGTMTRWMEGCAGTDAAKRRTTLRGPAYGPSARAVPRRAAATPSGLSLPTSAVPDGAPRPGPDLQPGLGGSPRPTRNDPQRLRPP